MAVARPALVAAGLAAVLFASFLRPMWDIDLFWHVQAGRWILENQALPDRDIFSYTDPNRPWHTFQWLYEVLCWLGARTAGLHAVQWAHLAVVALALGGLCWSVGRRAGVAAGLLCAACALVGFGDRVRERPDVFNLLLTIAILPWVLRTAPLGRARLWALAGLGALWVSLHAGGALLLPTLLGARAVARWAHAGWSPSALREAAVEVVPALGLLASPGYIAGLRHAFGMIDAAAGFIPEWSTGWQYLTDPGTSAYGQLTAVGIAGWPMLALLLARRQRPTAGFDDAWLPILVVLPLVVLAGRHMRFLWLPSLAPAVVLLWLPHADPHNRPSRVHAWVAGVALAVGLHHQLWTLSGGPVQAAQRALVALDPGAFPAAAARLLRDCGQRGTDVFNHAAWGGYLLHALGPGARVFSDGRGNFSASEAAVLADLNRVSARRPAIERAFAAAPFQWLVHPSPFPLWDHDRARWVLLAKDPDAEIWLPLHAPGGADRAAQVRTCLGLTATNPQSDGGAAWSEALGARRIAASASLTARQGQWQAAATGDGPTAVTAARQLLGLWFNHGLLGRCAGSAFGAAVDGDAGVQYWRTMCTAARAGPAAARSAVEALLGRPAAQLDGAGVSARERARLARMAQAGQLQPGR